MNIYLYIGLVLIQDLNKPNIFNQDFDQTSGAATTTTFPNRTESQKIWRMKKRKELGHDFPPISPPPKSRRLVSTNCFSFSSLVRIFRFHHTHCSLFNNYEFCWTETWRSGSATYYVVLRWWWWWWWKKRKMQWWTNPVWTPHLRLWRTRKRGLLFFMSQPLLRLFSSPQARLSSLSLSRLTWFLD